MMPFVPEAYRGGAKAALAAGTAFLMTASLWLAFVFATPAYASAATLSFSPTTDSQSVGDVFTVNVTIDPGGSSVNAADGTVTFDPTLLTLESDSKDSSVFSLWTSDPTISNSAGTLTFSGGTPTAFSTGGTVLTLKFKALAAGTATLAFSKGDILAADGKGTNVYSSGGTATVTISAASANSSNTADTTNTSADNSNASNADVIDTGPPPIAPTITSATFPDDTAWYATSTAMFSWNLPPDATAVRTMLTNSPSSTPTTVLKPLASSTEVTNIPDGVSYFLVQVKNSSGWGDIGSYEVQVDTQPPANFTVALEPSNNGSPPELAFQATDALSGIDHYEILLGTTSVATIPASELTNGTYPVPPQGGGSQLVTIRAFDKAGNMTEASSTLDLPAVAPPAPQGSGTTSTAPPSSPWTLERILLILCAFAIGGLVSWMRYTRKTDERYRSHLTKRIAETREKNDLIFSAMREEFEQMVNDLDKRPQLTPEERAFLENVKEVLDVSEEIIDTGMDELKKLVREGGDE